MNYHTPLQVHSYWNHAAMLVTVCNCDKCPSNRDLFLLFQYNTFVLCFWACFLFCSFYCVLLVVLVMRGIGIVQTCRKLNSKLTDNELIRQLPDSRILSLVSFSITS